MVIGMMGSIILVTPMMKVMLMAIMTSIIMVTIARSSFSASL
ncbi:hypothetical protein E2C01_077137 [Portunus trituberculatus]|uniref:Uncharacterized protein n=1 Tax=Portunus trituberculatus TaxID=210409 RepID=A0A5B7INS1_PORTR|nr:hypothetical protein [Portunus trituberculatus]